MLSRICFAASLLLVSVIMVSDGKTVAIDWSAEGVAVYSDSAVSLSPGDTLVLSCPNGSYSNVFRMEHQHQYGNCSCNVTPNFACVGSYTCVGPPANYTLMFVGTMFRSGSMHYFASFSDGRNVQDSVANRKWGGECVSKNLRLRVYVLEPGDKSVGSKTPTPSLSSATPTASRSGGTPLATDVPDSESSIDLIIIIVPSACTLILLVVIVAGIIVCVKTAKRRQDRKLLITSPVAQQGFSNPYYEKESKENESDGIYDVVASNEGGANTVEGDASTTEEERIYDFIGLALPPVPEAPPEAVYDVVEGGVQTEVSAVINEPVVNSDDQTTAVVQQYPLIVFDHESGSEYQQPRKQCEQEGAHHTTTAIDLYQYPVKQPKLTDNASDHTCEHQGEANKDTKEEHGADPLTLCLTGGENSDNAVIEQCPVLAPQVKGIEEAAVHQHPFVTPERTATGITNADRQAEPERQFEFTQPGLYEVPYIPKHSVQQAEQKEIPSDVPKTSTPDDDGGSDDKTGQQLDSGSQIDDKCELPDRAEFQKSDIDSPDTEEMKILATGEETKCEIPTEGTESKSVTLSQLADALKGGSPNSNIYNEHPTSEKDVPVSGDTVVLYTKK